MGFQRLGYPRLGDCTISLEELPDRWPDRWRVRYSDFV